MSNYDWSFKFIEKINVAFEIGSRDLIDANTIQTKYNCKVYSFECNPDCIKECHKNNTNKNITLIEKAVSQVDGTITFYSVDINKYNNMGCSSMFEIDFTTNRNPSDGDYGKTNIQQAVCVPSVRLDTFCKEYNVIPDVIFMDVQEAELEVLKSASSYLKDIKYIVLEGSTKPTYTNGCDIVQINEFLEKNNFSLLGVNGADVKNTEYFGFGDYVYINKSI